VTAISVANKRKNRRKCEREGDAPSRENLTPSL
jgi:hypothetical protein